MNEKLGLLEIISFSEKADTGAPTEILLLKYGLNKYRNGLEKKSFSFSEKDADAIIKEFNEKAVDLNIDYEHQSLKGGVSPAAGWGSQLEKTSNGLMLKMKEWTKKAKEYIENKEYRYFSPVILFNKKGEPARLFNLALTNTPKLDGISALIASEAFNLSQQPNNLKPNKGNSKMIQKLMMALGLPVAFSEKPIEEQETGIMSKVKDLLSLQEDAKSFLAMHEQPDFNSATGLIQGMVSAEKFNEVKSQIVKRDAAEVVTLAMSEGKIADNFKEWAVSFAEKDLEGFKIWSQNAPSIVPTGADTGQKKQEEGKTVVMSEEIKNVYKSCGLSGEEIDALA